MTTINRNDWRQGEYNRRAARRRRSTTQALAGFALCLGALGALFAFIGQPYAGAIFGVAGLLALAGVAI